MPCIQAETRYIDSISPTVQVHHQHEWGLLGIGSVGCEPPLHHVLLHHISARFVTAQAPTQASPLPVTPAAALIQSLLRGGPHSASCGSPMEGVPERAGLVLQPKTPAFVSRSACRPVNDCALALHLCKAGVSVLHLQGHSPDFHTVLAWGVFC